MQKRAHWFILARVCQRDATALRTVATKRQVSEITDKQIEVLLRRLNGICSVTGQIVDNSSDLIYRNGLLGLTNQVAKGKQICINLEDLFSALHEKAGVAVLDQVMQFSDTMPAGRNSAYSRFQK